MKKYTGPLWLNKQFKISLANILENFPDNSWKWCFFEFDGVGEPPTGLTMESFERIVNFVDTGYSMNWNELNLFAKNLCDIQDCLLVSTKLSTTLNHDDIQKNVDKCHAIIEIFDSGTWTVWISDSYDSISFTNLYGK